MNSLKIDELIEFKEQISKDKHDNELLEKILLKLKNNLEKDTYKLEDLLNSKIGKSIKDLLLIDGISSANKNNVEILMNLMKQVKIKNKEDVTKDHIDKEKPNENKKMNVETKDENKQNQNNHTNDVNGSVVNENKKELNSNLIKSIKDEFIKEFEPIRQTTRGLLFDSLLGKDNLSYKVDLVKSVGDSAEKYLYKNLYTIEDGGNKYKNRIKTLVFNITVS